MRRRDLLRQIIKSPVAVGTAVLTLLGTIATVRELAVPEAVQAEFNFYKVWRWPWWLWTIIVLIALLLTVFEGAYRAVKSERSRLNALRDAELKEWETSKASLDVRIEELALEVRKLTPRPRPILRYLQPDQTHKEGRLEVHNLSDDAAVAVRTEIAFADTDFVLRLAPVSAVVKNHPEVPNVALRAGNEKWERGSTQDFSPDELHAFLKEARFTARLTRANREQARLMAVAEATGSPASDPDGPVIVDGMLARFGDSRPGDPDIIQFDLVCTDATRSLRYSIRHVLSFDPHRNPQIAIELDAGGDPIPVVVAVPPEASAHA